MKATKKFTKYELCLKTLEGLPLADGGATNLTAPIVHFSFGEEIGVTVTLLNLKKVHKTIHEVDIFTFVSSWKLCRGSRVICNNKDNPQKINSCLSKIFGSIVEYTELDQKTFNLKVYFKEKIALKIICHRSEDTDWENYTIRTKDDTFTVEKNLVLTHHKTTWDYSKLKRKQNTS